MISIIFDKWVLEQIHLYSKICILKNKDKELQSTYDYAFINDGEATISKDIKVYLH